MPEIFLLLIGGRLECTADLTATNESVAKIRQTNSVALSPQANYTDCATANC
jgi:hypothetical protein